MCPLRVPRGSVVKCLTRNPGVLGSSRPIKGVSSKCIFFFFFFRIMPHFRLGLFILYQAPHSLALAPACGALVLKKKDHYKGISGSQALLCK